LPSLAERVIGRFEHVEHESASWLSMEWSRHEQKKSRNTELQ